jgi:U4/U6 small nuclear ribonucleoprotein PRP3
LADGQRLPPPDVEWWDKALIPGGQTYDDLDEAMDFIDKTEDSLITHLVQHPIPIPAPGDKKVDERGLMLTKKEQKKMRRQRRMADLEDKRDRQKMGLLPPDAPKGESCDSNADCSATGQSYEGAHVRCGPRSDQG